MSEMKLNHRSFNLYLFEGYSKGAIYVRFKKNSEFHRQLRRLFQDYSFNYINKKFLGSNARSSGVKLKRISKPDEKICLEDMISIYNGLREIEKYDVDISVWIDEAKECVTAGGKKLDMNELKEYLKKVVVVDNKS